MPSGFGRPLIAANFAVTRVVWQARHLPHHLPLLLLLLAEGLLPLPLPPQQGLPWRR